MLRAPGRAGETRTPVPLNPNEVAWPLAYSSLSPGAVRAPGELQWHIQLSILQFAARKRRQKHRWKESNPRNAGLESGLLPKLTDVKEIKRAALVGRSRRAAPGVIL